MINSKILRRTLQSQYMIQLLKAIIEALKEENFKLQIKCKNLEAMLFELQKVSNKQDQYTMRNNLKIHGIPLEVRDDQLEEEII